VKSVVRETSWFANGPLTMVICPIIFVISFCFGISKAGGSIFELKNEIIIMIEMIKTSDTTLFNTIVFWISFGSGLVSILIGSMSSIATTAISREGKGLQNILAMPFSLKTFLNAKMLHAMFYSVLGTIFVAILVAVIAIIFAIPLSPSVYIMVFVNFIWFSLVTQFIINMIDMLIDVCHPKLSWENPIAVFKQNLIATVAIFLSWGIIALLVLFAIYVIPTSPISLLLMNIGLTAITIPTWLLFLKFAKKKLENLY
jgi:ABC-2 type transport system permease protein